MNALISTLSRNLTCAAAALLISLVVSMSFVHSTATASMAHAPAAMARSAGV
jgi:hypothetical protein